MASSASSILLQSGQQNHRQTSGASSGFAGGVRSDKSGHQRSKRPAAYSFWWRRKQGEHHHRWSTSLHRVVPHSTSPGPSDIRYMIYHDDSWCIYCICCHYRAQCLCCAPFAEVDWFRPWGWWTGRFVGSVCQFYDLWVCSHRIHWIEHIQILWMLKLRLHSMSSPCRDAEDGSTSRHEALQEASYTPGISTDFFPLHPFVSWSWLKRKSLNWVWLCLNHNFICFACRTQFATFFLILCGSSPAFQGPICVGVLVGERVELRNES